MKQRIVLLQVNTNQKKIERLYQVLQHHFTQKEHIMLFVPDQKTYLFVDELLWKFPEDSFLPHITSNSKTKDLIVITQKRENLNQAKFAFNLSPTPLLRKDFLLIYDFDDRTSPHKKTLSHKKFQAYKEAKWTIESR